MSVSPADVGGRVRITVITAACMLAFAPSVSAQTSATPTVVVDEVWQQQGQLQMALTARNLLDDQARRTVEQGGTSAIDYTIEIYRYRTGWFHSLIRSLRLSFRLGYDAFDRTYRLMGEDIRLRSDRFEEVAAQCTRLAEISLGTFEELGLDVQATYYISVRLKYQPVTTETLDELRSWLGDSGDREPPPVQQGQGLGVRLARLLMNAAGLGERELTGESIRFRPGELPEK